MLEEALADLDYVHRGGSLSKTCHKSFVEEQDVARWARIGGISVPEALDRIGVELARAYAMGARTWEFCDWAANQLYSVYVLQDSEATQFWNFYLAFDQSENFPAGEAERVAHLEIGKFLAALPERKARA